MAEELLVTDRVETGARFIERLNERIPVASAFWMLPADSRVWRLYVASDAIRDDTIMDVYAEVGRLIRDSGDIAISPYDVWLLKAADPIAERARRSRDAVPHRTSMTFLKDGMFGDVPFDEAYVYPRLAREESKT